MKLKLLQVFFVVLLFVCTGCKDKTGVSSQTTNAEDNINNRPTIIAYYFHRTMRCPSCIAIEANAADAIENNFKEQLANERLVWLPVNLGNSGGEAFEKEFDITISTLVLAKIQNGKYTEYKKLEKVWELLGDTEAFSQYIVNEINKYLQ